MSPKEASHCRPTELTANAQFIGTRKEKRGGKNSPGDFGLKGSEEYFPKIKAPAPELSPKPGLEIKTGSYNQGRKAVKSGVVSFRIHMAIGLYLPVEAQDKPTERGILQAWTIGSFRGESQFIQIATAYQFPERWQTRRGLRVDTSIECFSLENQK